MGKTVKRFLTKKSKVLGPLWEVRYHRMLIERTVTFQCLMPKKGQVNCEDLAVFAVKFAKCVWPFSDDMHQRIFSFSWYINNLLIFSSVISQYPIVLNPSTISLKNSECNLRTFEVTIRFYQKFMALILPMVIWKNYVLEQRFLDINKITNYYKVITS